MDFKDEFRELIHAVMEARGFEQQSEVAEYLGVTPQSVTNSISKAPGQKNFMLSKSHLEKLLKAAKYSQKRKDLFMVAREEFLLSKTQTGRKAKALLAELRKHVNASELHKILKNISKMDD